MPDCTILSQVNGHLTCLSVMHVVLDHTIGLLTVMLCLMVPYLLSVVCKAASFLVVIACSAQHACSCAFTNEHGMLVCDTCGPA